MLAGSVKPIINRLEEAVGIESQGGTTKSHVVFFLENNS